MKTNPLDLDAETTTLATCWYIVRRDGQEYRYTDHDAAIALAGQGAPFDGQYQTAVGYDAGEVQTRGDMAVDELTVSAILDDVALTDEDIRAGLLDYATVWLFLVDWSAPASGIVKLRRGTIGEVALVEGRFEAELRGLAQALQQVVGETYSAACRADLGDARCGVDLGSYTVTGTLTAVTDRSTVTDGTRAEAGGWFDNGLFTFTGGANAGTAIEIKEYAGGTFTLHQAAPYAAQPGDAYEAVAGCQKTLDDCRDKYDNVINFRGEPHVPGQDEILGYPDAG